MDLEPLTRSQIDGVCGRAGIGPVRSVEKVLIGFSNEVHIVNDAYVLKSSRSTEDDEVDLKKEIYLVQHLVGVVPVPEIVHADSSRETLDRVCIIYKRITGDNLYMRWHEYSRDTRRDIVRTICGYLRAINDTPYEDFVSQFHLEVPTDWQAFVVRRINENCDAATRAGGLPADLALQIRAFVEAHQGVLADSDLCLTYVDPHFDNFIVRDGAVVGMLDFESTNVRSKDVVLDLVRRMVVEPTKYVAEQNHELIKPDDYVELLDWYREFSPELFAFPDMEMRLTLYAIKYDLKTLSGWPRSDRLRQNLRAFIAQM